MAKVLGEAARYLSEQSSKKFQRIIVTLYLLGSGTGFVGGYFINARQNIYISLIAVVIFIAAFVYIKRSTAVFEAERLKLRKGAVGETIVAYVLESFPDDYRVVHDLQTQYGNIDHVVIGPTGVYIIDAKNWRGIITADGNGELLLNGKATGKTEIKNLTRNIMNMREKIKTLCSLEPFMQGVMAFPSAYIDAKWGTTGYVHCVTDEKLYDYIVENKNARRLDNQHIESISQAFLALARMDKGFA